MRRWHVQEAKARFSEMLEKARAEGPQVITRHGVERAVILSIEEYRTLVGAQPDLMTLLLGGPKFDDFEITRDTDTGQEIEL